MTDNDFERIKAHFMEDSAISFPDFVSLREDEADVLIARITSISDKGTLRRLYQSAKKGITEKTTQDAQEVYDWLMESNVLDGVLRLPEGAAFPIAFLRNDIGNVGENVVLVRNISKHLCEMVDWIRDGGKVYGLMKRGLIVRGPPGDGKSFTSQYLIWYYVKRRVTVVYEDVSGEVVWVFRADGQCRRFTGTADLHTMPELQDSKTVFIHDADANYSDREPVEACKATLVAFAPTNDKFLRQTERGPVVTIGFVTPNTNYIYKANRVFGANIDMSELNDRIEKYGCHLRGFFDKSEAAVEATLAQAIDRLLSTDYSIDGVLAGGGIGVDGESAPTVLFSTSVKPEFEEAFNSLALGDSVAESESKCDSGTAKEKRMAAMFRMYHVGNIVWTVVSEHVYGLIMEKARDKGEDFANQFLRAMSNNHKLNTTLAPILEVQAPTVLSGGGQFRCRVLNKLNTPATDKIEETVIVLPKTTLDDLVGEDKVTDVQTVVEQCTKSGVLYNFCGQFSGVDALSRPVGITKFTDLFNYAGTVTRPSVNFEAVAALNKKGSKESTNGEIFFNFVVADEKFDLWTHEQPFDVETAAVELKDNDVSLWKETFLAGSSVEVTSSLSKAELPIVTLTGSHVKVIHHGHTTVESKEMLAKKSVKLPTASLHYMSDRSTVPFAKLPAHLQLRVGGLKQRVISYDQHPHRKNGSKCHFSTMAAGYRNLLSTEVCVAPCFTASPPRA